MAVLFVITTVLCLFSGTSVAHSRIQYDPMVVTPLGTLQGYRMMSRGGRKFLAFSGVPYAKPPLGDLRFQPPVPVEAWTGIKDAKEDGPFCVQYNMFNLQPGPIGVEDCLYLSLYTHNVTGNRAVLVHFHGGGFSTGNGARITGPQYLMDEDVVVVDVNYRLSMFGFLSFEDLDMPGNQGLKDQLQALRWIQQNIESFGGDPNRVTLVGESAGGGSVFHHMVSPLSKGLFHAGIAESGTCYNPWAFNSPGSARNASMLLLSLLNCTYTNTKEAVACLTSKDATEIVSKTENMRWWQIERKVDFGPVQEPPSSPGAFLVGPVKNWNQAPVPLIIGTTSAEGLIRTVYFESYNMSYQWFTENFNQFAPKSLKITKMSSKPLEVTSALRQYYLPRKEITEKDWVNLTTLYSDSWFTIGILDGANKHSGDVYFYYFDYLGEKSSAGNSDSRNGSIHFGANHIEEMTYLWYNKEIGDLAGEDLKLSKKLVKLWTDFAKYGTPTPEGSSLKWNKWTPKTRCNLVISKQGLIMKEGLADDRYRFWKTLPYNDLFF